MAVAPPLPPGCGRQWSSGFTTLLIMVIKQEIRGGVGIRCLRKQHQRNYIKDVEVALLKRLVHRPVDHHFSVAMQYVLK